MNRLQHTARIAVLAVAPVAALAGWLWLQPSYSAAVLGAPAAGGIPQLCIENPSHPSCAGTQGATDEGSAADENHEIPFAPAAAYPALAALGFGCAHLIRRRTK